MEIALMTEPQTGGTYEDLLALARWAEELGLDAFARSDHYLDTEGSAPTAATDALATIAGLARETARIQLVVLVSPITFRHPAVLAKTAATIDQMAAGRFALGMGTGWMEREHNAFGMEFHNRRERFRRLGDALGYLRAAFHGGAYAGKYYNLQDFPVLPRPSSGLEIIVGGSGLRKTPALAGRFAHEYNLMMADINVMGTRIGAMRDAARSAGRDPDAIRISAMAWTVVGVDELDYRERLGEGGAALGLEPDEYEALLERESVPRGTLDQLATQMAALEGVGVERIYLEMLEPLPEIDRERLRQIIEVIRSL